MEKQITINYQEIDWKNDDLPIIRAKQSLHGHQDFLLMCNANEIRAIIYTEKCIKELKDFIYNETLKK